MDPSPLLALLLLLLGAARALSTCQRLDLEAAKKKRIEAVRGQILSKLRLTAPPPASETPPRPLPDDVRALYNSTQELLKQRARLRPPPDGPDEYWAKELRRIPMETTWDGPMEHWQPQSHSIFFVFNVSRVRAEVGGRALLHRAELRMLRQKAAADSGWSCTRVTAMPRGGTCMAAPCAPRPTMSGSPSTSPTPSISG